MHFYLVEFLKYEKQIWLMKTFCNLKKTYQRYVNEKTDRRFMIGYHFYVKLVALSLLYFLNQHFALCLSTVNSPVADGLF